MTEFGYLARVYKIWWDDDQDCVYVGSTKSSLSQRMSKHRSDCRGGRKGKVYDKMNLPGNINTFRYVLLDTKMVEDFEQQRQVEQEWIEKLSSTLNTNAAYRSAERTREQYTRSGEKYRRNTARPSRPLQPPLAPFVPEGAPLPSTVPDRC